MNDEGRREAWMEAHERRDRETEDQPVNPEDEYEEYDEEYVVHETVYEEVTVTVEEAGGGSFAAGTLALAGGMVADDVTVIGVADDPAIPFVLVGGLLIAGVLYLATTNTTTRTRVVPRVIPRTRTRRRRRRRQLIYVTYRKTNPVTGQVYIGRSRGYGTPQQIVAARDRVHHMTSLGFGPARLDRSARATLPIGRRWADPAYQAIRGREQQMIDYYGGAWSDVGRGGSHILNRNRLTRSGNAIRGVAAINPLGRSFDAAATAAFGRRARYTGR